MKRAIIGYYQDEKNDWVAELNCGHGQHVRHQPPFFERPWVTTAEGRQSKIGSQLYCVRCDASEWPVGLVSYKKTDIFTEATLPKGLQRLHRTKAGIWGLIHCKSGRVKYVVEAPVSKTMELDPDHTGIVIPEVAHHIEPLGSVEVFVEFFRLREP